jgi:hypothetical protein
MYQVLSVLRQIDREKFELNSSLTKLYGQYLAVKFSRILAIQLGYIQKHEGEDEDLRLNWFMGRTVRPVKGARR